MKHFFVKIRNYCNFGVFFENRSNKQIILKNTFWLGLAQGFTGLLNFFISVYVIRVFGATEYGKFAYALSVVFIFSTLFDFGLSTAVIREFARDKGLEKHFSDIFTLKALFGCLVVVVIFAVSTLVTTDIVVRRIIWVLAGYMFAFEGLNFIYSFFRSRQKMEYEAFLRFLHIFSLLGTICLVLYVSPDIFSLSLAYFGVTFFVLIIAVVFIFFKVDLGSALRPSFNLTVWKSFLVIGFYLALSKGVGDITMFTDSIFLGYLDQIAETGYYNAALKVVRLFLFPMGIVTAVIFPLLTSVRSKSEDKFRRYWFLWMKVSVFFSFFFIFMVFAVGENIIEFIYSAKFLPAAKPFKILVIMASLVYIHNVYCHALLIFDQQKRIFYVMFISAIVNVALNALLIPKYSMTGAAVASVASHLVISLFFIKFSLRYTAITNRYLKPILLTFAIAVVSGVFMFVGFSFLRIFVSNTFIIILFGAVLYSVVYLALNKYCSKKVIQWV